MIFLYVAVVTMAGAVPVGFYLGLRYAAARAEFRRPVPAHEALARVYQMPIPAEWHGPLSEEYESPGPCPFLTCLRTQPHTHPVCPTCGAVRYGNLFCDTCSAWHAANAAARPEVDA